MGLWSHKHGPASPGHIPFYVFWVISLLIPIVVALVNFCMVLADLLLVSWKFTSGQDILDSHGLALGTLALAGISVFFGFSAALLVVKFAPSTAGSGIPEVLGFLNGNQVSGIFTFRSLCIRTIGIVLSQAAGFPLGREGPMVAIGSTIGFGIAFLFTRPYELSAEKVDAVDETQQQTEEFNIATSSFIMSQERFAHARRIGCALGGAAGIATAFNAPIGGILYMFEELSTSSVMPKFHVFMCTVISAFMTRFLLDYSGTDFHRLVIYEQGSAHYFEDWDWQDLPFFALLAALVGGGAGFFSIVCVKVWFFRFETAKRLSKYQPYAKLIECSCYCVLCASLFSLAPTLINCSAVLGRHLAAGGEAPIQHACADGEYNEAATLLLQGAEGAVKHLYSRMGPVQAAWPLVLTLALYSTLAMGMAGLCVPMGTFVPSLLIGGISGRILGEVVNAAGFIHAAPAGVYAVVGSAAMLAGFTHMTIGLVVVLGEATNDLGLIIPLMLSVHIARYAARCITHHGFDEQLIIKKGVPFLDADITEEMDTSKLTALDICCIPPKEAVLPKKASLRTIKRALRHRDVNYFPVVSEGGHCAGLTTRGRLKAVLAAFENSNQKKLQKDLEERIMQRAQSADSFTSVVLDGPTMDHLRSGSAMNASKSTTSFSCDDVSESDTGCFSRWLKCPLRMLRALVADDKSRKSQGHLADHVVEGRMKSMIREMFSNPGKLYSTTDDHCPEESAPHEEGQLPIDRVMDPAPFMIQENTPVQRFYPLFRNVDMNIICVLSNQGRFLGMLTRRGLISCVNKLTVDEGRAVTELQAANRNSRDEIEASWNRRVSYEHLRQLEVNCHTTGGKSKPSCLHKIGGYPDMNSGLNSGLHTPALSSGMSSESYYDSSGSDDIEGELETPVPENEIWDPLSAPAREVSFDPHQHPDFVPQDGEWSPRPSEKSGSRRGDCEQDCSEGDGTSPRHGSHFKKHRRKRRSNTDRSSASIGSRSDGRQTPDCMESRILEARQAHRSHTAGSRALAAGATDNQASDVAMTMAEMLEPTELRAQLASAWSRLAASEQQQEELLRRLSLVERQQNMQGAKEVPRLPHRDSLEVPSGRSSPRGGTTPRRELSLTGPGVLESQEPAVPFTRVRRPSVCSKPSSTGSTASSVSLRLPSEAMQKNLMGFKDVEGAAANRDKSISEEEKDDGRSNQVEVSESEQGCGSQSIPSPPEVGPLAVGSETPRGSTEVLPPQVDAPLTPALAPSDASPKQPEQPPPMLPSSV